MEGEMKRLILYGILISGLTGAALAHPPSEIMLQFNPVNHILDVTVMHDVRDSTKHYIGQIKVEINGQEAVKQVFSQQTDRKEQCVSYVLLDAKPGDEITVKADCNMFGSKKQTLKVTAP
jgi:hypothetical protein